MSYISQVIGKLSVHWQESVSKTINSLEPITKLKNSMKGVLLSVANKFLLSNSTIIETINDELKNIAQAGRFRY